MSFIAELFRTGKNRPRPVRPRFAQFEQLESRELLAVTAGGLAAAAPALYAAAEPAGDPLPTGLTRLAAPKITGVAGGGGAKHVATWTAVENASAYRLSYSADGAAWQTLYTTGTTAEIGGLVCGDNMQYRVRAIGEGGYTDSNWSAVSALCVCPPDIDGDGFIGPGDYSLLSSAWFSTAGGANWNPACDVDGDGFAGPGDLSYLSGVWFQSKDQVVITSLGLTYNGESVLISNTGGAEHPLKSGDVVTVSGSRYPDSYTFTVADDADYCIIDTPSDPGDYEYTVTVSRPTALYPWRGSVSFTVEMLDWDAAPAPSPIENPAEIAITGNWQIEVRYNGIAKTFEIDPPETVMVTNERYSSIVVFNSAAALWTRGTPLAGVRAYECTVQNELVSGSVTVSLTPGGAPLTAGVDYIVDEANGVIGRREGGRIGANTAVYVSYQYVPMRIDSIVCENGDLALVRGTPHAVNPAQPNLRSGQTRVANNFVSHETKNRLTDDSLYPILDDGTLNIPDRALAKILLPKTWEKLQNGEPVKILIWGDSVSDGGYIDGRYRWQNVFLTQLRKRFPKANIQMVTQAWGGHTTADYLAEPAGSAYNYRKKVLDVKPDLIISEFVNDAGLPLSQLQAIYPQLKADFDAIGAEWIINSPHYIHPAWMGLTSQKNIDNDPRPYTAYIRQFGKENRIPVAEASTLYGRLWRQGIPYNTLMVNNINHPNAYGLSLYADALMVLFGKE